MAQMYLDEFARAYAPKGKQIIAEAISRLQQNASASEFVSGVFAAAQHPLTGPARAASERAQEKAGGRMSEGWAEVPKSGFGICEPRRKTADAA
jgi:plasmid replication initiation protein